MMCLCQNVITYLVIVVELILTTWVWVTFACRQQQQQQQQIGAILWKEMRPFKNYPPIPLLWLLPCCHSAKPPFLLLLDELPCIMQSKRKLFLFWFVLRSFSDLSLRAVLFSKNGIIICLDWMKDFQIDTLIFWIK